MTNAIKMTIAKNGTKMFYVDGKRISRDKAIEISKNADNEMLTNALGANVELKDAQAILAIATKDPLEAGKDREFGWCFTNVIDAVEAAKKVAALFGDRFIKADVRGDATFDNKVIATVDAAGNVEIKKQTPEYIFTAYQTVTGVDCNGRTERVESFATTCKELGDDDNFTGLYRAVTFYEDWHYNAWDIKTADGKLIAKGNTEAELKKAYEAIKAGNVEVSEEIAEINAADVKVNVAQDGKIIEQIKVDVDTAIKIINRLNYRNDSFIYSHATFDDYDDIKYRHFDAYKDNGEPDAFALTEIVINGKLEIVRFANLFRDIIVHLQIGNVNYTIGDKGAIVLTADKTVTFYPNAAPKPCTGKLFDYSEYHNLKEYVSELKFWQDVIIIERLFKNANGTYSYDGWGRKTYYMTDCYREAYYVACDTENVCLDAEDTANLIYVEQQLKNIVNGTDGSEEDIDADNAFDLLPALDELNNVDIDDGDDGDDDNTPPDDEPMSDDIDDICKRTSEVDPAEYAISEAAMEVAINAEGHNADVASGNYSVDINGEYVWFENHSIVRIDAMRKMNWIYDHTGANKIFRYGNRKSSAAKVIAWYMNRERAKEQDEYFREFFIPYNKARGEIEVWVELTYADGEEHTFRAEFNQGRLADKFIADVKELAGDTPCQIFKKYRDNHIKPVWEDPHKYETVGNLEHARHLYGEETVGDIAPEEYIITQEAMDEAIEAEEVEALATKMDARILADPIIDAAYRKAKERVEVMFTKYGYPQYRYRKTSGEWTDNERVAKAYISKCGLSQTSFIVKAKHDKPADTVDTPPANQPDEDDISDICKRTTEDDDKPVLLDWDNSAIAHTTTDEEELSAFVDPQIVNYSHTFTTKTAKNGKTLYYIDGKRVGRYEYMKQFDYRAEQIDALPEKQLRWLNPPEDIDGVITLASGVEGSEVADVKGLADSYIDIDGAAVQSVEVKTDGRRNQYYVDGKRAKRDKAIEACAQMRGDNHFTIEYQGERKTMSRLDMRLYLNDSGLFDVVSVQATIHTFEEVDDAINCVNQIEAAYLAGKAGVKVDSSGTVSDLDEAAELEDTYKPAGMSDYEISQGLTAKLKEVTRKVGLMDITMQDGNKHISGLCNLEVFIDPDSDGFIFTDGYETLARYGTKEQCEYVIDWIKKTVADGGNEFEFPTAEFAALEMHAYELLMRYLKANYRYIGRHCWQMRIGDKWRNAPHRFLTAQLKYYGLSIADLRAYKTA